MKTTPCEVSLQSSTVRAVDDKSTTDGKGTHRATYGTVRRAPCTGPCRAVQSTSLTSSYRPTTTQCVYTESATDNYAPTPCHVSVSLKGFLQSARCLATEQFPVFSRYVNKMYKSCARHRTAPQHNATRRNASAVIGQEKVRSVFGKLAAENIWTVMSNVLWKLNDISRSDAVT